MSKIKTIIRYQISTVCLAIILELGDHISKLCLLTLFRYSTFPSNLVPRIRLSFSSHTPKLCSHKFSKGSHQKKNYKILDIDQTWGGSVAQPNLLSKKGMDMFEGGRGVKGPRPKQFFVKKFVLGVPEELLCVKIIYILHATSISHTYPKAYPKIFTFLFIRN